MERGLRVRNEGTPVRCEICHQSDCLDPFTGVCSRCRDLVIPEELIISRGEEEKPAGLIIPFTRTVATQVISALLAVAFGITLVGPVGVIFFAGLCCFIAGLRRFLADSELTGRPSLDLIINFSLMSAGFTGFCFGGLYFLRILNILR
jgi:hypothetical protein